MCNDWKNCIEIKNEIINFIEIWVEIEIEIEILWITIHQPEPILDSYYSLDFKNLCAESDYFFKKVEPCE